MVYRCELEGHRRILLLCALGEIGVEDIWQQIGILMSNAETVRPGDQRPTSSNAPFLFPGHLPARNTEEGVRFVQSAMDNPAVACGVGTALVALLVYAARRGNDDSDPISDSGNEDDNVSFFNSPLQSHSLAVTEALRQPGCLKRILRGISIPQSRGWFVQVDDLFGDFLRWDDEGDGQYALHWLLERLDRLSH
jgi:hypothetical protein